MATGFQKVPFHYQHRRSAKPFQPYDRFHHIWLKTTKVKVTIAELFEYFKFKKATKPALLKFYECVHTKSLVIVDLVYRYMETKYYEFDVREIIQSQYDIQIKEFIEKEYYPSKRPREIFIDYIKELDKYCFQGGFGHSVYYGDSTPHHWCLKPEHYDLMGKVPEEIIEIQTLYDCPEVKISSVAEYERWSS